MLRTRDDLYSASDYLPSNKIERCKEMDDAIGECFRDSLPESHPGHRYSDYQPITDEHFMRRCSAPVEDVSEDDDIGSDDWQWIEINFH